MTERDISWPEGAAANDLVDTIDRWIDKHNLFRGMVTSMRSYPGCTHWHLKRKGVSGTLELTIWPESRRLWFSMRPGRIALWMDRLPDDLEQEIGLKGS